MSKHTPEHDEEPVRRRGILAAPIGLVSALAVALGIATPAQAAAPEPPKRQPLPKPPTAAPPAPATVAVPAAAPAPTVYRVADGDTVSGIAERFGLPTAEVLALNGLGWSTLIFPGQELRLRTGAAPVPAAAARTTDDIRRHTVAAGDTIGGIAAQYGASTDAVLRANGLGRDSLIFPGQAIIIPGPAGTAAPADAPAPPPAQPPAPPAAPAAADSIVVRDGDTVWDLAAEHGVSVQSLLDANGLGGSAVIRPGERLSIPRPVAIETAASVRPALTEEMRGNARLIIDVGRSLGVPDDGIVVAITAAAQESGLKNVVHGDRDSLGLFQQRPSQGWGTAAEVLDPVRAATAFYGGDANPNPGRTRGLLDIPRWQEMTVAQAAQAVQNSAFPNHYAKWEQAARQWLAELG
ncbi:muramidase family protein [Agromyces archimandritae]|uniref:LysM peptidoglycan-binding domain-containing protein n=1 Tax=Agromyces archimandritae TaxID=2781962 RepID=A0A975FN45_9MICO|nr:LysM peptidoglycan-binding domain-containing protein [Agromyces archimandritae]QTX04917.1 LysM peptidoglycan-binding domain-containing protein [Agromyces archimandritae]